MESNINKNTMITKLAFAMELYWLNQLKKQNLVSLDEYYKLKNDINNKYKKRGIYTATKSQQSPFWEIENRNG